MVDALQGLGVDLGVVCSGGQLKLQAVMTWPFPHLPHRILRLP